MNAPDDQQPREEFHWRTPWRWSFTDWFDFGSVLVLAMIMLWLLAAVLRDWLRHQ